MKVKIALLVKAHFARYCRDTFLTETEEMVLSFFTYVTLEEMIATYQDLLGKYDAVIVSGPLPYTILHNVAEPDHPILACFRYDIENTYRIILRESIKRQCLDLSRVGIEALPPGVSLQQAINENTFPHYAQLFEGQFLSLDFKALKQQEEEMMTLDTAAAFIICGLAPTIVNTLFITEITFYHNLSSTISRGKKPFTSNTT